MRQAGLCNKSSKYLLKTDHCRVGFTSTLTEQEVLTKSLFAFRYTNGMKVQPCAQKQKSKARAAMYLSLLLLVNAADIELNPGPCVKYPCQICNQAVTWKQRGVACDDCEKWYHVDCMHMSTPIYVALAHSNVSWHCVACGLPQFSTSLFDSHSLDISNSFSSLSSANSTPSDSVSPGPPLASSSPYKKCQTQSGKKARSAYNKTKGNMKILIVNFQSAKNKKEEIGNMIESADPDIILGTETWLNPNIFSSELFPPTYNIFRKDRNDGYGGVLIALKKEFTFEQLESNPDLEACFIKLPLDRSKSLIIGALYRPPSSSTQYMEEMCSAIEDQCRTPQKCCFLVRWRPESSRHQLGNNVTRRQPEPIGHYQVFPGHVE